MKTTQLNQKQISGSGLHLFFIVFPPFNCGLSVILLLNKGDWPENLHVVFCPKKTSVLLNLSSV